MRVAIFNGPNRPIRIEQVPDPTPAPDDVTCHPVAGCGDCEACRRGYFRFCATPRPVFGGFDEDTPEYLGHKFDGLPHIVAECVGKPGLLKQAVGYVRPGGTVISLGMCMFDEPILAAACTAKEVKLVFPSTYSLDEFTETVRAFEAGHVRPEVMVSHVVALDDLVGVLDNMRAGQKYLKVQVDPSLGSSSHV